MEESPASDGPLVRLLTDLAARAAAPLVELRGTPDLSPEVAQALRRTLRKLKSAAAATTASGAHRAIADSLMHLMRLEGAIGSSKTPADQQLGPAMAGALAALKDVPAEVNAPVVRPPIAPGAPLPPTAPALPPTTVLPVLRPTPAAVAPAPLPRLPMREPPPAMREAVIPARPVAATPVIPVSAPVLNLFENARAEAQEDWYALMLDELNGLGARLREGPDHEPDLGTDPAQRAAVRARAQALVDTLAWDVERARAAVWTFARTRLRDPEDAWAPHVVLRSLETDPASVREWVATLAPEAQILISEAPLGGAFEKEIR